MTEARTGRSAFRLASWIAALVAVVVVAFAPTSARADGKKGDDDGAEPPDVKMQCQVIEILATKTDHPSVAPELKDVAKKLKTKAFSAWNTFTQSGRSSKTLSRMVPETFDLPNGKATVMIREVDHPAKKRARVTLDIGLAKKSGKHYADTKSSVDAGDFLLFARGGDDGIITAVGCQ